MWIKIFTQPEQAFARLADGKPQLLRIGKDSIALVRKGNQFFAVDDLCTHIKESLSGGIVNFRDEIICPWHNYCFDLRTGREAHERSADLRTYALRLDDEGLWIELPD